jgi:hypothetical protein
MWHAFWTSLAWKPWKQTIKRACKKHLLQENLAWDVSMYHSKIVDELKIFGGQFAEEEDHGLPLAPMHCCSTCLQSFLRCNNLPFMHFDDMELLLRTSLRSIYSLPRVPERLSHDVSRYPTFKVSPQWLLGSNLWGTSTRHTRDN